jgi:multidrug efflux pump subunit AcrA (membrane-fusion protein)
LICLVIIGSIAISVTVFDFESFRIDKETLLIDTVRRGDLDILVSANGELLSRDVELISALIGGRVTRVLVAPGDDVVVGQALTELSNPQVIVASEESFSAWEGSVADLKAFKVELKNRILDIEVSVLNVTFSYEKEILKLEAEKQLFDQQVISEIEYRQRQLSVEQLKQTVAIEEKRLQSSIGNIQDLLAVKESRVTQLARSLDRANERVSNLKVVAGITGMVQSLDLEVGQQLELGFPIGKLARQGFLYGELKVPARQAAKIRVGQNATIDTRNGVINGRVSRIDPGVTDGIVIVDIEFTGHLPEGSRPQLAVEGIIHIAHLVDTLYVGKPSFAKVNDEINLYKLDQDLEYASRVRVKLGRSSVSQVEILEGLEVGDQVILSDSSDWQKVDKVLLN